MKAPRSPGTGFGYACGALRVSTRDDRGSIGPRAHVNGFLGGLAAHGVDVRRYITGDRPWALRVAGDGSDGERSRAISLRNDAARLALLPVIAHNARRTIGNPAVLYERQATFQAVGRPFQRRGAYWVVESNGPFWYEAAVERGALAMTGAAKRLELSVYRRADLVVAVSEALRSILLDATGRDPDDVIVLPNATDTDRFDPDKARPIRDFPGLTIGFSGYLTEWAGVDLLIDAVSEVRRRGVDMSVKIIGDGPARTALERQAADERLTDCISFTGLVPWSEVPDHLAGLDLGYSGQRAMSIGSMYHSPQKIYEYLAMGIPVVASAHPDATTLVSQDAGWTFESGDGIALADALEAASQAKDRAARGAAGRDRVRGKHNWTARTGDLLGILRDRGALR